MQQRRVWSRRRAHVWRVRRKPTKPSGRLARHLSWRWMENAVETKVSLRNKARDARFRRKETGSECAVEARVPWAVQNGVGPMLFSRGNDLQASELFAL